MESVYAVVMERRYFSKPDDTHFIGIGKDAHREVFLDAAEAAQLVIKRSKSKPAYLLCIHDTDIQFFKCLDGGALVRVEVSDD